MKSPLLRRLSLSFSMVMLAGGLSARAANLLKIMATDTIVLSGGEDIVQMQKNGYLELLLMMQTPGQSLQIRNMGWEGDTAYEQYREVNFSRWSNQLARVQATIVIVQYGKSEALQGVRALPQFLRSYEGLVNEFLASTPRVVLLSPTPFERNPPPLPDLSKRNEDLRAYVEAIRAMALRRGLLFIDLFTPLLQAVTTEPRLTKDGLHLTPHGHWLAARETVKQLGFNPETGSLGFDPVRGVLSPARIEQARQALVQKNEFWFHYWRPMNWAFLHGDRVEQPSSRDHRNPAIRWFPQELEQFQPLIRQKEGEARRLLDQGF